MMALSKYCQYNAPLYKAELMVVIATKIGVSDSGLIAPIPCLIVKK